MLLGKLLAKKFNIRSRVWFTIIKLGYLLNKLYDKMVNLSMYLRTRTLNWKFCILMNVHIYKLSISILQTSYRKVG